MESNRPAKTKSRQCRCPVCHRVAFTISDKLIPHSTPAGEECANRELSFIDSLPEELRRAAFSAVIQSVANPRGLS